MYPTTKSKVHARQTATIAVMKATHPGIYLSRFYRTRRQFTITRVAEDTGLCYSTIYNLFHGYTRLTVRTAIKFEKAYATNTRSLLKLQQNFDLEVYRWMNT